jgi:hypothetical protein
MIKKDKSFNWSDDELADDEKNEARRSGTTTADVS